MPPGARCSGWTRGLPLLRSLAALGCSQSTELGFLTFASVTMFFKYCVPSMKLWEGTGRGADAQSQRPPGAWGPVKVQRASAQFRLCGGCPRRGERGSGKARWWCGCAEEGGEELCGVRMSAAVTGCGRPQQVG